MSWHPIKKDAWETTEIIAFRRRLTGRVIQQEAGARSGSANNAPAEKKQTPINRLHEAETVGNVVHR